MDRRQFIDAWVALGASTTLPVLAGTNNAITGQGLMRIGLVGVGGAGGNTMAAIALQFPRLGRTIAIQTRSDLFNYLKANRNILIGDESVVAIHPTQTRKMAMAHMPEIEEAISHLDLVFILAGMGGATGTGIAPLVAEITQHRAIPTFGMAITPFEWEGAQRNRRALLGIHDLERSGATVFPISNARMERSLGSEISQGDFFEEISHAIKGLCICISHAASQDRLSAIDFENARWRPSELG